jgi:hypothetical protein
MDKKYSKDKKHQKAMEMFANSRVNYFGLSNKRA